MVNWVHIIEDDDIAAFILQKEVENHDYFESNFKVFENGEKAIGDIDNYNDPSCRPDLIFLDINMPVMDGWDYLQELEKRIPDFNVPIVMLTSSINPDDVERAKKHKAIRGFYSKPITKEILTDIHKQIF